MDLLRTRPQLSAVTELLKPITWFPPMWAFACGVVASGVALSGHWGLILLGILLAGPMPRVNAWYTALAADARARVTSFATDPQDLAFKIASAPEALLLDELPCDDWDARFAPENILTEKGILR